MSLDGFIAGPDDDLSFLSLVEEENEDYGYNEFIKTVDTVIMGRKTYDKINSMVNEFPHKDKEVIIISATQKKENGKISFYNGDLTELASDLKRKKGGNIFIDGGADVVNGLLMNNMIDEYYISVIPVLLGEGVRLFKEGRPESGLILVSSKSFRKGLVQLHYRSTKINLS